MLSSCRTQSTQLQCWEISIHRTSSTSTARVVLRHISHKRTTTDSVSDCMPATRLVRTTFTWKIMIHRLRKFTYHWILYRSVKWHVHVCIHVFMIDTCAPSFNPTTIHLFIRTCNLKTAVHPACQLSDSTKQVCSTHECGKQTLLARSTDSKQVLNAETRSFCLHEYK
jgi:hypothetical protein